MDKTEIHDHLLSFPNTELDFPFGDEVAVYKVKMVDDMKMFALIPENRQPLQISLKCDPNLAVILREKYETVLEGYHLNKKHWNTILLTGQLEDQDVKDMIVHSYNLVIGNKDGVPDFATT